MGTSLRESFKIGVDDMTDIPDIDEVGINNNLKLRYETEIIYVSFSLLTFL